MSYPKPLSEKSLKRLYTQARLSTEACDFLHSLFAACANLYGAIALRDVWSVYRELKSEAPRIRRQDLVAFSAIVRREVQPYQVYEIEELYTEEPHNDLDRHIVSKELIGTGYGKMFSFYALMEGLTPRCSTVVSIGSQALALSPLVKPQILMSFGTSKPIRLAV